MKTYHQITAFVLLFLCIACKEKTTKTETKQPVLNEAQQLINDMTNALGGMDNYSKLKDVTFSLVYRDTVKKVQDASTEKFMYNGELSWAEYHEHTKNVFPDSKNPVTQAWNGKQAWVIVDGNFIPAPPAIKMAKFARNTSFFWFNMMYKMADQGTLHNLLPDREFKGITYKIVEVTYDENIGDAQDKFLLYINPGTKLVDHFIFSNMFFGPDVPPRMMHVDYETYDKLKFPKKMHYEMADWDGNLVPGPMRSEKIFTDVKFNTEIEKSLFDKPILTNVPMADIRNSYVKKGITEEDKAKGRALIKGLEEACGGYTTWKLFKTATFTQTADWYENETNWTTNPQEFKSQVQLGTANGQLTLLNGPQEQSSWRINNGMVTQTQGKDFKGAHEMVLHKQVFKSYWFQLPFKIGEADIISYAGKRNIKGTTYDVVFATWHTLAPNTKYDQYMLYLHPDTHDLDWLEFTLRDIFPFATGISQFTNYKEHQGIRLPMSQYITQGTLSKPGDKMHENHYQMISFK